MKVSCARIITQTLPGFHYHIQRCFRQMLYCREFGGECLIIASSLFNPRLLQNDLGKPYFIRVLRVSPWKITLVFFVPGNKCSRKILHTSKCWGKCRKNLRIKNKVISIISYTNSRQLHFGFALFFTNFLEKYLCAEKQAIEFLSVKNDKLVVLKSRFKCSFHFLDAPFFFETFVEHKTGYLEF